MNTYLIPSALTAVQAEALALTLDECWEYVDRSRESESEQRAEYGMGAVSLGYDPYDAMIYGVGDGAIYTTAGDPLYAACELRLASQHGPQRGPHFWAAPTALGGDDLPF